MSREPRIESMWPWVVRFTGLAIAIYETVVERVDRPSLLMLAGAMVLGPEFVRFTKRNGNGDGK